MRRLFVSSSHLCVHQSFEKRLWAVVLGAAVMLTIANAKPVLAVKLTGNQVCSPTAVPACTPTCTVTTHTILNATWCDATQVAVITPVRSCGVTPTSAGKICCSDKVRTCESRYYASVTCGPTATCAGVYVVYWFNRADSCRNGTATAPGMNGWGPPITCS